MATLSNAVSELRLDMMRLSATLDRQTTTLKGVADDTREVRDFMRGGKVLGKLSIWLSGIVTVPLSVYGLISLVRKWLE